MYPSKGRHRVRSERDRVLHRTRLVGQSRELEHDNRPCRIQNVTGGSIVINPENAAYRVVAFSGPAPESEREKNSAWDCEPGLELEEHGMKFDKAFSPRIPLLLGLLLMSIKPQQSVRAGHGGYNQLIDHVGTHGQRRLTEALNKDSLVRQKEYPMESSSKSRESIATCPSKGRDRVRSERDRVLHRMRRVDQSRELERDNRPCRVQNVTGGSVVINPENAAYRAIAFSGPAPESEREKDSAWDCRPGLELEEHGMKLDQAFSPQIPLLLGLLYTSSKPQQCVRAAMEGLRSI
ncbi:hypothetical protein Taro_038217 [Colocasia esculenta]|uniref:Uncharacterized protein n=1 Tax=Colocasia esculenta TaxID=4460 RepID=A0A843WLJ3_COLES|nr:hypothetical protein [Colocasia esculenta]